MQEAWKPNAHQLYQGQMAAQVLHDSLMLRYTDRFRNTSGLARVRHDDLMARRRIRFLSTLEQQVGAPLDFVPEGTTTETYDSLRAP